MKFCWRTWNPWALRRDLATYAEEVKALTLEGDRLRSLLMELRTASGSHKGRTGYAVTAFIPHEVVVKLRPDTARQMAFVERVATHLVRRALLGLVHVKPGAERPDQHNFPHP